MRVFYSKNVTFNELRSMVEWIENEENDGDEKHSVVEIECQNISESEDDNSEKNLQILEDQKELGNLLIYMVNGLTSLIN